MAIRVSEAGVLRRTAQSPGKTLAIKKFFDPKFARFPAEGR
jgi:hypothetical protein